MGRSRVRSFLSALGAPSRSTSSGQHSNSLEPGSFVVSQPPPRFETPSPGPRSPQFDSSPAGSLGAPRPERLSSRPESTLFTHTPPLVDVGDGIPPELQPIFSLLNSHANKLYYEGYFLKLNDLDTHGRSCPDRQWIECYAQLVGTTLTLWDAAALDAAGEEEEVPPTFINLADASIKMIETLPTKNPNMEPLKNILSVSSAGQNRYLLHFNSFHSLTQWTAAIRLTIFELTSLHEAYTGSLIAGKGKHLNNIQSILGGCRFKHEDWARVRFGAGTPWRRCWFVINPPNEKEVQKLQKSMKKKRSAYDRAPRMVMGNIKFYESKKTKKTKPIATIENVYAAYAIYPQSKSLIEQSTLVKIEGQIITHSKPVSTTEGFVFVMPEVHAAISGFEMLIRFLIPTFDTFSLYGRPTRLIAETNHIKSIMFAFPKNRRHGYLDTLDVTNLLQTPGSQDWSEEEWRKQLKGATANRMAAVSSRTSSVAGSGARFRSSLPNRRKVRVESAQLPYASPEIRPEFNRSADAIDPEGLGEDPQHRHVRVASDTTGVHPARTVQRGFAPESLSDSSAHDLQGRESPVGDSVNEGSSSDSVGRQHENAQVDGIGVAIEPSGLPSPVAIPPGFTHGPREMPSVRPQPPPDMRKVNRMSNATLAQLAAAGRMNIPGATSSGDYQDARDMNMSSQQQTAMDGSGRSRLETIGDSENAGDEGIEPYEQAPAVPEHTPPMPQHTPPVPEYSPPVPQHALPLPDYRQNMVTNTGPPPFRSNAPSHADPLKAIKRKPAPQTQPRHFGPPTPTGEPTFDDLRHAIDEDALNQVGTHKPSARSHGNDSQDEESLYDAASTTSPDYASTHESTYSKQSAPRPRMGVVKTVGTVAPAKDVVVGDARYAVKQPQGDNPDIPSVDFGPTLSYFPTTGRPRTSDNLSKNFDHHRKDSDATERKRYSTAAPPREYSRSPSKDELRRSMVWQPGMATGRSSSPGFGLTPEQYVQQLAEQQQVHAHGRTSSSLTPPPLRPSSGEWASHSRGTSYSTIRGEIPSRPSSRGARSMLNYNDVSSHLTAREQEHVARMTGSSFFNLSSSTTKQPAPVDPMGLVGAIDAREREKQGIKEGLSNKMVQHAIAQRQQHQQYQQNMLQQQQRYSQAAPGDNYTLHAGARSMYNLPTASRTWDALHYPPQDDTRRGSWYGPYASSPQTPPVYQQSQVFGQHPGYFGNANTMYPNGGYV